MRERSAIPPSFQLGKFLQEATKIARAQPVASTILLIVAWLSVGFALAASGEADAFEREILATLESPAARSFIATSADENRPIPRSLVDATEALSSVETAFGLGPAQDMYRSDLGPAGIPVAIFPFYGDTLSVIDLGRGRLPRHGETILSKTATRFLGLEFPNAGLVVDPVLLRLRDAPGSDSPVVGEYDAVSPYEFLDTAGLLRPEPDSTGEVRRLVVTARTYDDVGLLRQLLPTLAALEPTSIQFESSAELEAINEVLRGDVANFARLVALSAIGVGALLTGIVTFASVYNRRVDFGRRRALGADRSTLLVLVLAQVLVPHLIGVLLGALTGWFGVSRTSALAPNPEYTMALSTASVLTAAMASLSPALFAAYRDPIRALRVP